MPRLRSLAALGLAAIAVGTLVNVAGATTNLVPNPGFEDASCAPLPCNWLAGSATLVRDTSTFASGSASLRIDVAANTTGSAGSGCLPLALAAGSHDVSYWYNNSNPNLQASATRFEMGFYSGPSCSTFVGGAQVDGTGTGGWLHASGTVNVPAGTTGVFFTLYGSCFPSGPCSAYYDDIDFEAEVTAVTVASFAAARSSTGVRVRWRTGTETDMLGFHVYRSRGAKLTRVDTRLIRAHGSVAGARYSFLDRRAPHGKLTYRLQAVGTDGSRAWYGRARVMR